MRLTIRQQAEKRLRRRWKEYYHLKMTENPAELERDLLQTMKQVKRYRKLWRNWPPGKDKMAVVLEHIRAHPQGLTIPEIRQFVWEMNGYKGKAKRYYWMTLLKYPTGIVHSMKALSLLESWCIQDPITKRWRFKKGQVIKPPYLKPDMRGITTAGDYRRVIGHEPSMDNIRLHMTPYMCPDWNEQNCSCYMPDDAIISKDRIPEMYHRLLEM